ncbi:MAG TPA: hypothetical protein VHH11_04100 [Gammaproteobacteria bacterium]|jgi:cation:H+ antiporter|nr:hypothetical protein [Gammaproteobacteria bacterium]
MPLWIALVAFVASVGVMSVASEQLTRVLERFGARFRISEGLLGIVTALGADAPEISSAFSAVMAGHHEIGVGVVLGSNIFNLAALLGLSAVIAGQVTVGRQTLWFNGGTSLLVSAVALALVLQCVSAAVSLVLLGTALVPYVTLLAMHPGQLARLRLPAAPTRFLEAAIGQAGSVPVRERAVGHRTVARDAAVFAVSLMLVVGSSAEAVHSAIALGAHWGVSQGVIGTLVLAALTSIPNVVAAVHLAREGRGAAVVSESLNSNTLNILAGLCLPALVIGFTAASPLIVFASLWLIGMKLVALAAASHRNGLRRLGGLLLIALYLVFAVVVIVWQ